MKEGREEGKKKKRLKLKSQLYHLLSDLGKIISPSCTSAHMSVKSAITSVPPHREVVRIRY